MKRIIFAAAILMMTILIAGCTQQEQTVPVSTPTPTATPAVTMTTSPAAAYVALFSNAKTEIDQGKTALGEGKTYLGEAMTLQSQTPEVVTLLSQASANFTLAKTHFTSAHNYYIQAQGAVPSAMTTPLTLLIDSTQDCVDACDMYLNAISLASTLDWYGADAQINQANLKYETAIEQINAVLNGLNLLS